MTFFYEEQAYPVSPDYDLNRLAEELGIQYNPYQGYPNKIVPDQVMDIYGPMDEYLLPQMYKMLYPNAGEFSQDAFWQASPQLRGPAAEALSYGEGDPIEALAYAQTTGKDGGPDFQGRLRNMAESLESREQIARSGDLNYLAAITGDEKKQAALDFYNQELESLLAGGAPTHARAMGEVDATRQREGFRPAPGTGDYDDDPLASLASSPQYSLEDYEQGGAFGPIEYEGEGKGRDRLGMDDEGTPIVTIGGRRFKAIDPVSRMGAQRVVMQRNKRRRQGNPEQKKPDTDNQRAGRNFPMTFPRS
jgi:hypothetical protein